MYDENKMLIFVDNIFDVIVFWVVVSRFVLKIIIFIIRIIFIWLNFFFVSYVI